MSLIKCPECGQMISSTTRQCIHCGCKITFCSECGSVLAGDIKQCPNCGAPIEAQEKTAPAAATTPTAVSASADPDTTESDGDSIRAIWKKGDPLGARRDKILRRTTDALFSIIGSLFVAVLVALFVWVAQDDLKQALNIEKTNELLKDVLIAIIVIGACAAVLANIVSLHMFQRSTKYLSRENVDVRGYFEKYRRDGAEEPYADLLDSADGEDEVLAYTTVNRGYMVRIYIIKIVDIFFSLASCVSVGLMLMDLLDLLMVSLLAIQPVGFDYSSCIVAGVIVVAALVYTLIVRSMLIYTKPMKWLAKEYNVDLSDK